MEVSKIKPRPGNPRSISEAALEKLKQSIERDPEFMILRPIVIDDDDVILGGNMRLKAIQELGMTEIPDTWVVKASDLTEEQRKRFILVDNAPAGMSGLWEYEELLNTYELPELLELGFTELDNYKLDLEKEWQGMPEFDQKDKNGIILTIHFQDIEDKEEFHSKLSKVGININDTTRSFWYPERPEELRGQTNKGVIVYGTES